MLINNSVGLINLTFSEDATRKMVWWISVYSSRMSDRNLNKPLLIAIWKKLKRF